MTFTFQFYYKGHLALFLKIKKVPNFKSYIGGAYTVGKIILYLVVNRWKKIHCLTGKYKVK